MRQGPAHHQRFVFRFEFRRLQRCDLLGLRIAPRGEFLDSGDDERVQTAVRRAKQAGFTEQSFNTCLANQQVLDGIESIRKRAVDKFKVQSTPTFFINGTQYPGALSAEEMTKLIDPYLKG